MEEEIKKEVEQVNHKLPKHVLALLEAHALTLQTISPNATVEYRYDDKTGHLQFVSNITYTPEITTDNPINYEEK